MPQEVDFGRYLQRVALNFFPQSFVEKVDKNQTRRIDKGPHYRTSITDNNITAAHTVWCVEN